MVAPMAGQIMLLAMLLALRQWMFAAMIVPSLLGCMASLALALPRRTASAHGRGGISGASAANPTMANAYDAATVEERTANLQRLPAQNLEPLLGMHHNEDRLPWRTVARQWLQPFSMDVPIGLTQHGVAHLDLQRQGPHATRRTVCSSCFSTSKAVRRSARSNGYRTAWAAYATSTCSMQSAHCMRWSLN